MEYLKVFKQKFKEYKMQKYKKKLLEFSDRINFNNMEYSIYSRDEFIEEMKDVSTLSEVKSYLDSMETTCDALYGDSGNTDYLRIKLELENYKSTI